MFTIFVGRCMFCVLFVPDNLNGLQIFDSNVTFRKDPIYIINATTNNFVNITLPTTVVSQHLTLYQSRSSRFSLTLCELELYRGGTYFG